MRSEHFTSYNKLLREKLLLYLLWTIRNIRGNSLSFVWQQIGKPFAFLAALWCQDREKFIEQAV